MSLTQERVRELFEYHADTGILIWRNQPISGFSNARIGKTWNTRWAGKTAGCIDGNGYSVVHIFGRRYQAHRLIWLYVSGSLPEQIDHINGQRHDNRISNLRAVSRAENLRNQKLHSRNTSGVCGVTWDRQMRKWRAKIGSKFIGLFESIEQASIARKAAERSFGYHENHGRTA